MNNKYFIDVKGNYLKKDAIEYVTPVRNRTGKPHMHIKYGFSYGTALREFDVDVYIKDCTNETFKQAEQEMIDEVTQIRNELIKIINYE